MTVILLGNKYNWIKYLIAIDVFGMIISGLISYGYDNSPFLIFIYSIFWWVYLPVEYVKYLI